MSIQVESRLASLGWDAYFEEKFKPLAVDGRVPARVIADYGSEYLVHDSIGPLRATAAKQLRNDGALLPAVGDWVALLRREPVGSLHGIVERRTVFSRKVAAAVTKEQVLAANIDIAFVIAAATDVNARRIERYLTMAWQSGAVPMVLLTKADVVESVEDLRIELEAVAMGTPVIVTSAVTGLGMGQITEALQPTRTGVLLGPSGAGKSTLINFIVGSDLMKTREIHSSGEGRHMTSHRQLVQLPGGGMIIDTPGLRQAQLWEGEEALGNIFEDIEELALSCKFGDCGHRTEPGCAIKAALADGSLEAARFESYKKLQRELRAMAAKTDVRIRIEERRKWKQINMAVRAKGVVRP